MELQYLGHAGFRIAHEGLDILIDPYLSEDDKRENKPGVDARMLRPNYILLTHEHFDHCDIQVVKMLARRHSAKVIGPPPVERKLGFNVVKVRPNNSMKFDEFNLRVTQAFHHQSEVPLGYILEIGELRIYHAGDTYYDKSLGKLNTDIALLPIGGTYTMNVEEAAKLAAEIRPKIVIPMHFDTFGNIKADPKNFCKKLEGVCKCVVLKPGEVMKVE
ncbi:MAG: metal-dependent hydrolase [Candidatus Altiarchaeota archaeon]|nr:metal-dependent hydrolase [Candidatus Altiarchaeota archaeon]